MKSEDSDIITDKTDTSQERHSAKNIVITNTQGLESVWNLNIIFVFEITRALNLVIYLLFHIFGGAEFQPGTPRFNFHSSQKAPKDHAVRSRS